MQEIWTHIPNFEEYSISNYGRVRTFKNHQHGKYMVPGFDRHGYYNVGLRKLGKKHTKKIHRLVAEVFIPNPNNLPIVNHKDGNKQNNRVDNLEWCTYQENTQHAVNIGLFKTGSNSPLSKPIALYINENIISYYTNLSIMMKILKICWKVLYLYNHLGQKIYDVIDIKEVDVIPPDSIINLDFNINKEWNSQVRKPIAAYLDDMPIAYYKGYKQLAQTTEYVISAIQYKVENNVKLYDKYELRYISKFEYLTNHSVPKNIQLFK